MNIEDFREYCIAKKGVTEEFPFGDDTLVFKVAGKMFALTSLSSPNFTINLKCQPEKAIELRDKYEWVKPGYHMNKKHWNTIYVNDSINDAEIYTWIDKSYHLVLEGLPKYQQALLRNE